MSSLDEFAKLVENARQGEKEALDRLAEAARVRLEEYVFRLTLEQDLTQDIVQETILEMFRVFEKLKRGERFWPWLYGIATNKLRNHYGRQWRHRAESLAGAGEIAGADGRDGLADAVTREFKQIVLKSMDELQPRHRAVLTMRCYDQMAYSEIAKVMGCSEFGVRSLFCRAKKALAKKLGGYGLGKSSLLIVLGVFGKITATSEAAAANVSVTAATLKVGLAASLAATATSKRRRRRTTTTPPAPAPPTSPSAPPRACPSSSTCSTSSSAPTPRSAARPA
jgi:RNA polymerase sigma-70 factor (ECF subfamily)